MPFFNSILTVIQRHIIDFAILCFILFFVLHVVRMLLFYLYKYLTRINISVNRNDNSLGCPDFIAIIWKFHLFFVNTS